MKYSHIRYVRAIACVELTVTCAEAAGTLCSLSSFKALAVLVVTTVFFHSQVCYDEGPCAVAAEPNMAEWQEASLNSKGEVQIL